MRRGLVCGVLCGVVGVAGVALAGGNGGPATRPPGDVLAELEKGEQYPLKVAGGRVTLILEGKEVPYTTQWERSKVPASVNVQLLLNTIIWRLGLIDSNEFMPWGKYFRPLLEMQEEMRAGRGMNEAGEWAGFTKGGDSELAKAMALLVASEDKPDGERRAARAEYGKAYEQEKVRRDAAEIPLKKILSPRQEAMLVRMGVLETPYQGPQLELNDEQRKVLLEKLRKRLAVGTDAEWEVIEPRVVQVLTARRELQAGHDADPLGLVPEKGEVDAKNPLAVAARELAKLLDAQGAAQANDADLKAKMTKVRDARRPVSEKLTAAQKDLAKVVTFFQEGMLIRAGLLEAIDWSK